MTSQVTMNRASASKRSIRRSLLIGIAAATALGGTTVFILRQLPLATSSEPQVQQTPAVQTVTALGRLEPDGEVIRLSAPTSSNESRIEQLLVKENDLVKVGQVIAILNSRDHLQTALKQAEQDVRVAEAQLAQVLAGAKTGEIQAQRSEVARLAAERAGNLNERAATVARLEAEVQNAQVDYNRYQLLYQQGAVSASERDTRKLTLTTAQRQLQEAQAALERVRTASEDQIRSARATLDQIAEVRPVDVEAARAEVARAIAARDQAQASLSEAYVRSPQEGTVLRIHTRAGEVVSQEAGIVDVGKTSRMYAVAEVYQSDIHKIQVGQRARVTSEALPGVKLTGTVETIYSQVERQDVINADPSDNIDNRIVEVKIRLDAQSSQRAAKYTNLQVKTVIER